MRGFLSLISLLVLLLPGILATSCAASPQAQDMKMAPMDMLPQEVQAAPTTVREAYQFAAGNPAPLKNVPCYCGCGAIGHTSNYSCYIKNVQADGKIIFDQHALGCSLCVDITQDVIRLSKEGKSPGDIHSFVVANYSRFGPPNQ
jgi:uncharacterized protein with PCYCGC motif